MPEHRVAAEILEIGGLHLPVAKRLIRKIAHVLEDEQPCYQPRWQRRLARPGTRIGPSEPDPPLIVDTG